MALGAQSHATLRVESAYAAPVPRAPSTPRAVNPSAVTHRGSRVAMARSSRRSGQVLPPCPPLRVAETGDDSKRRCASRPTSGANNRWSATAASTVPAVPTSVVVQTPSRGPYQMMAGSWGTTARAMLDRNAYAKSSAVGVAGRCMARCFAHRSQADIKPPQYARRVAGEADLGYDAPSPGDEALHEESHRRQHDSEGVGIRKGFGARQAGRVRWHRVVVGRRPMVSDGHPG